MPLPRAWPCCLLRPPHHLFFTASLLSQGPPNSLSTPAAPLQVGGEFLSRFYPGPKIVLIPTPSWANHRAIFERCGMQVQQYR